MAIYRQLHTTFWKDKRVGEWSKDQKLFFLYLLSNDYTTQCGVYEFNIRYAKFELDMTAEEIKENIDFLVSEGRIVFNEKSEELMIVNWLKYNNPSFLEFSIRWQYKYTDKYTIWKWYFLLTSRNRT